MIDRGVGMDKSKIESFFPVERRFKGQDKETRKAVEELIVHQQARVTESDTPHLLKILLPRRRRCLVCFEVGFCFQNVPERTFKSSSNVSKQCLFNSLIDQSTKMVSVQ